MQPDILRQKLTDMLGIPKERVPLDPEPRGSFEWDGVIIEKWILTSEQGSRLPAVLYRPPTADALMPGIVFTFGHGGSKSSATYNLLGQMYARLGLAALAIDPIGEEERHIRGETGTRAHDPKPVSDRADAAGRLIMGKLVYDTMRGVDWIWSRDDIDPSRLGVVGNSLGGAKASWMAALDTRLRMAIVSGWAYDEVNLRTKFCTRLPTERLLPLCGFDEFLSLAAPQCAVLIMNGDADVIIDHDGDGRAWRGTRAAVQEAKRVYASVGAADRLECWFEPGGGHRPYPARPEALEWIHRQLGTPGWALDRIRSLPTTNYAKWAGNQGITFESLYGTSLHACGATIVDMGIRLTPMEQLACLRPDEMGAPEYTLEGWLNTIDPR